MTDTNTDPFAAPAKGGDRLPLDELLGSLLLFTVHSVERDIQTTHGTSDAIRCDVAALDGDHKADTWDDTLVFPRVLQGQLRPNVGGMVLGRLTQGAKQPGKNPPWMLDDPTDADREIGRKYLAHVEATKPPADDPF